MPEIRARGLVGSLWGEALLHLDRSRVMVTSVASPELTLKSVAQSPCTVVWGEQQGWIVVGT